MGNLSGEVDDGVGLATSHDENEKRARETATMRGVASKEEVFSLGRGGKAAWIRLNPSSIAAPGNTK